MTEHVYKNGQIIELERKKSEILQDSLWLFPKKCKNVPNNKTPLQKQTSNTK